MTGLEVLQMVCGDGRRAEGREYIQFAVHGRHSWTQIAQRMEGVGARGDQRFDGEPRAPKPYIDLVDGGICELEPVRCA
jgi:hypothetical protein